MRGNIRSDEKCPECGGTLVHDRNRGGLFCKKHPHIRASRLFKVRFGRGVTKRFKTYEQAERFLIGIRYKVDEGTFDERDYRRDHPLGFDNLAMKWIEHKEKQVKKGELKKSTLNPIKNTFNKAIERWQNRNIKNIHFADIEDFLEEQDHLSAKTVSNMRSHLHDFWTWLDRRKILTNAQMPEFPVIKFELSYKKTINKTSQQAIIDEIKRLTYELNPKIWLAINLLATYISIRPGELINLRERDIDTDLGYIFIPHPKEKKPKAVPLLPVDIDLITQIRQKVTGFPDMPFFCHLGKRIHTKPGQPFGEAYLKRWWYRACANLGVEGVSLYAGTKHSSAMALRKLASPEEIRRATMHSTNKAFERYYRVEGDELRDVYSLTRQRESDQQVTNRIGWFKNRK